MRREKERRRDEENKEYTLPTISPLDLAQGGFVCVFVFCLGLRAKGKNGKEERNGEEERERSWEEKRKTKKKRNRK